MLHLFCDSVQTYSNKPYQTKWSHDLRREYNFVSLGKICTKFNESNWNPIWNWVVLSESSSFLVLDSTFTFVDLMVTLSSSLALLLACILCSCNFNPVTFLPLPVALLKRSRHRSLLGWRNPGHVYGTKWSPKGPLTKKILLKQIETDLSCPNTFRGQLIFLGNKNDKNHYKKSWW